MAIIETRYWIIRAAVPRDDAQDAADALANNCVGTQGWTDAKIIDVNGSLADGWVFTEITEDLLESPQTKIKRNFKLTNGPAVGLDIGVSDESNAWIDLDQDTNFTLDGPVVPGSQFNLLIVNRSGAQRTVSFDPEFLVDHEAQLADNDADIPDDYGAFLEFRGLPGNNMLLTTLVVRQI